MQFQVAIDGTPKIISMTDADIWQFMWPMVFMALAALSQQMPSPVDVGPATVIDGSRKLLDAAGGILEFDPVTGFVYRNGYRLGLAVVACVVVYGSDIFAIGRNAASPGGSGLWVRWDGLAGLWRQIGADVRPGIFVVPAPLSA